MQVVLINGREVSSMTHDQVRTFIEDEDKRLNMVVMIIMKTMIMRIMPQVVNFIRAAREPHSGSLVLAVRQVGMVKRPTVFINPDFFYNIFSSECVPG